MTAGPAGSFVLAHGALIDSSVWRKVAALLRAAGASVVAPDNPGASELFEGPLGTITFQDYIDNISREIDAVPRPVVLVGHSMAGMYVSAVAERRPADIKALVYLSAYLPVDGDSVQSLAAGDAESMLGPRLQIDAVHNFAAISPDVFRETLLHDVPSPDIDTALAHQRSQPLQPFTQAIHLTAAFARVPKYYITTTHDRAVGPAFQQRMYERAAPKKVFTIEAGHLPFYTHAAEIADALLEIAAT